MRGRQNIAWLVLLLIGLMPVAAWAQPQADASVEPVEILIGQPAKLTITVSYHSHVEVLWPPMPEEIEIDSAHIIEVLQVDTPITQQTDAFKAQRIYTITAWDTGYYIIPAFQLGYKAKTEGEPTEISTKPVLLTVNTLAVDTAQGIKPIKDPLDAPFTWSEIVDELIIGALILLAIAALIVFLATRKKKPVQVAAPPKPADPPHVIAMRKLDELEQQKLWQNGDEKGYHSGITDILREYLEKRYGFDAMESTTDEIVDRAERLNMSSRQRENLARVFRLADLVKFAKVRAYEEEHKEALMLSRDFINNTKREEEETETPDA